MSCGAVRWFNETKGYGFIQPDGGGGKAVFVHIKAVQKAGFNGLVEGGKIAFRRRARSEDWKHLPGVLTVTLAIRGDSCYDARNTGDEG
jgi:cold shock protein